METKTKYYTSTEIHKKYLDLSLAKRNEVLYDAIDIMQEYNGRSRFLCIAMAMGFDNDEGDSKSYYKKAVKSVCQHEYITDTNWKSMTCRLCNNRIVPTKTAL